MTRADDGRPWRATVLTLYPEMFPGPLGLSLAGDALARGAWSLDARDIRDHGLGRHRAVDDTPPVLCIHMYVCVYARCK